ncbi:MAG: anaerobic ribonucleoside-triphosphate reductase [Bdellovibrionaceae bacterium]|nr:anaerobic ribonucleoside-triphosphate reductase [Pseudobdellovibrionaceae bacterium]
MIRLNEEQIQEKERFVRDYLVSKNAADASKFDANANVTVKNIATLEAEINKDINIQINRRIVGAKIRELYGDELAREYVRQIEAHEIYVHDETSLKPYCVSISMYPFLLDGLRKLGGESGPPRHLSSFCGSFINLVFAVSAQFAGAVATVEFLTYFDHFARREWGERYLPDHAAEVNAFFQQVVYSINQPAAARGYQSVFWNISVYDRHYFSSMFENFVFPDGDRPVWESVDGLQRHFLEWFNKERARAVLTFPVVTVAMLTKDGQAADRDYAGLVGRELSVGNSFFIYLSDSADSLASCCRLRNAITDRSFSYTLGAGGVATGSINVITLNMNRLVQDKRRLEDEIPKIHKYQVAYRKLMEEFLAAGMLGVYDAGLISLSKQYLTIGVNGIVEAAEASGIQARDNPEYKKFVGDLLRRIYDLNRAASAETGYMFNTEFVPAENLGVKNAMWDRRDGYLVPRDCYNSYLYVVEDDDVDFVEKFTLHGDEIGRFLDGGSALHLNLDEALSADNYVRLIDLSARTGCSYFCVNVRTTICNDCGAIDKRTRHHCGKCGSADVDHATRVIGYLKRVSAFGAGRRREHARRHYHEAALRAHSATRVQPTEASVVMA